ncbi:hypothetical protein N798_07420 [Knoellia flava TL1]|uniref:DNA repair ATPase n=2 Tax=Knoellia flava TaxID=913969 RepID=A0A8H9FWD4_9MICO|nr:ParB/Srx family N-terminal domain-containing protein [Knoellia flava]KGN32442.1 hypothetical protein N798_07420 [Knoellia flava TL1]GGB91180.1 DNA repair ATPase [Knoellia flava]
MSVERGSEWSIWDLHVHTPASIVQNYGGDQAKVWDKYLQALADLPASIRVLGINDYWFIDGYRRVRAAWLAGNLPNIELILPVVEMRLDILGGAETKLSRQNLHVLFDPTIEPDVIDAQFLAALTSGFDLSKDDYRGSWSGVVTRESLQDLGTKILALAPEEMRDQMASPLQVGFANLVMSRERIDDVLKSSYFKGRTLQALGKAEWSDMRWNQSAALKRDTIERADLLFTAFDDPERWAPSVEALKAQNVLSKLFDCSDAHNWASSTDNARLGNCLNWVNAERSFSGLRHALTEFKERVFVGVQPQHLQNVNRYPDRYIESVSIRPVSTGGGDLKFDYSLPLNSQFVAIVGNKGQGKSALLDCIALAGGSPRRKEFAFLNESRFLAPRNSDEASSYTSTIAWQNGTTSSLNLNTAREPFAGEVRVEYLPQAFVERVCTARPNSEAARDFEAELKKVLFSHIGEEERAGALSFEDLQKKRTAALEVELQSLRAELGQDIATLLDVVQFHRRNPLANLRGAVERQKAAVAQAESALAEARAELAAAQTVGRDDMEVVGRRERADALEAQRAGLLGERATIVASFAAIRGTELEEAALAARVQEVEGELASINTTIESDVYGVLDIDPASSPVLRLIASEDWREVAQRRRTAALERLAASQADIDARLEELQQQLTEVSRELAQIDAARENARQLVRDREAHLTGLIGADGDPQSLRGLEGLLRRRESTPRQIADLRAELMSHSRAIHANLLSTSAQVSELFAPVERFAAENESLSATEIRANVSLDTASRLSMIQDSIDRRRSTALLPTTLDFPVGDVDDWGSLEAQVLRLVDLTVGTPEAPLDPDANFKSGFSAKGFLTDILGMTWVRQRVELLSGDAPLSTLSPGQRGLVLLLFYLLIDRGRSPLLLDQPEENLDNDTVASVVVPALREASKRRQIIAVTHNANLAVVGDADQVVECRYENDSFHVAAGAISQVETAGRAVRVLEGTKPALENRYGKFRGLPAQ